MTGLPKFILLFILLFFAAMAWLSPELMREVEFPEGTEVNKVKPLLPLTFTHDSHREQGCADCHHNYQDRVGQGLCLDCHQRLAEVAPLVQQQFHELCQGCHREKRIKSLKTGPLRRCSACHTADELP